MIAKLLRLLPLSSLALLLLTLFIYPGHNQLQTLSFSPGPNSPPIELPPIDFPAFTGQDYPNVSAQAVFILDLNSSTILWQKNPDLQLHPASTTKVMTALVALDTYDLNQTLTVKTAGSAVGNTLKLSTGEQFTVRDLLLGLLISSANDAALTLAENYPGGYHNFITAMNQKAQDLHLTSTIYSNVSGIESADHKTTVRDLALLTKEALKSDLVREIVATQKAVITTTNTNHQYLLTTTNKLLGLPGVLGFKTGWTENAGECLITYVKRDSHPLITVVLNSADRFGDSTRLIDWAYANHTWIRL